MHDVQLGDVVVLKKGHACGTNAWKIVRFGADLKLECTGCGRTVMMPRIEVRKKAKKIIREEGLMDETNLEGNH
jgi:hypothetical protein